jgi:hypothetical protein
MKRVVVSLFVVSLVACAVYAYVGCGTNPSAPALDQITTPPADNTSRASGGVSFSMNDRVVNDEVKSESVTSRWANWQACVVTLKNDDTQAVLKSPIVLTPTHLSDSFTGIPGGTPVRAYAALFADAAKTQQITSGQSPRGVIVAGSNISLPITLVATLPVLTVQAPTNGATVYDDNVAVQVKVADLGANPPAVVLTDNGTTVTASPTITGDTINGYVFTWALTQADDSHAMVLTANSTSGGFNSTSWSYTVDNTGGGNVVISGAGR